VKPLLVRLEGHLTRNALVAALPREVPAGSTMIVDTTAMTSYDSNARTEFVDWNSRNKKTLSRVAVVTNKPLWRVIVAAMAVASGQNLKAFTNQAEAERWADA
jgi:hypothetical protein